MSIGKITMLIGWGILTIASIIKIIGRHKTGYCSWGEPELDIIQCIGLGIWAIGIFTI